MKTSMLAGHKEYADPGRKVDPRYDMDDMRAQVEAHTRSVPPTPPPEDDMNAEQDARLKRIEKMLTVPVTKNAAGEILSDADIGPRVGAIDQRTAVALAKLDALPKAVADEVKRTLGNSADAAAIEAACLKALAKLDLVINQ